LPARLLSCLQYLSFFGFMLFPRRFRMFRLPGMA
jgi:hypothetical protein